MGVNIGRDNFTHTHTHTHTHTKKERKERCVMLTIEVSDERRKVFSKLYKRTHKNLFGYSEGFCEFLLVETG
jgi:hypothetical protein